MSSDKTWTNPAFQPDDLEYRNDMRENYQIPRVEINKDSTKSPKEEILNVIPRAHFNGSFVNQNQKPLPNIKKVNSNIPIDISEHADEEEDYSLFSYFRNFQFYKTCENIYRNINENGKGTKILRKILISILVLLYIAYFIAAQILHTENPKENYWCDGDGFLTIITCFTVFGIIYFNVFKPYAGQKIYKLLKNVIQRNKGCQIANEHFSSWYGTTACYVIFIAGLIIFLIVDTKDDRSRLVSAFGIVVLLLFGFIFSVAPRKVVWRHVLWGMGLQFGLGLLILRWSFGRNVFECLGKKVQTFLQFTDAGSSFVFGKLVGELGVFAFKVLSVILFFSFCIQILYYYGAMQWIVIKIGWLLQVTIGTTACESVNAAANIFLGQSEAPLLIKPYLSQMTKSELHAVLTGGFATIAGAVLAAYISFGVDPAHLLSASVMSAPAALCFSKLFYPELKISRTHAKDIQIQKGSEANVLHAALEGVTTAIPLVANIAANLLAFIAFIAFIDAVLNWLCVLVSVDDGFCSLSNIFGYVFMPLAWVMGVPWIDCYYVGQLLGTKTIINEFVGYLKLASYIKNNEITKRSQIIATYALCGFSNISSIGIQLGALGALVPDRKGDIAEIAFRAMVAGSVACFLTACVAGTLLTTDGTHLKEVLNATLSTL